MGYYTETELKSCFKFLCGLEKEALQIIICPVKKFLHLRLRCYNKGINIVNIIISNGIYL
ncbi:MAG: hypothetical protein A3J81_05695 [Nitrospirae bacterium RIFOXYB2_FULL_43_5]|nr:MAG: hypothetical protein A2X54_04080 [Nitrospirae bacterium GWF2_44_13]OGW35234.1 MAG: hypothetical protein A2088_03270 [Nitrospirae bacterium GWD2_44_7]OGW64313.1 MAG: hypothetical protein A2222_02780 [Nitrospirae bacterium RIFOXYA2_FULL_44_9]OGW73472.1 MAG: hypothetical protein A2484_05695 [Nitrospirae bacterium RIFOXYC2_FULL_44_7]OGW74763.1 MAG: hypothetical protein A3J81_05695 [Nitrospirae bacterium RIFOXYB2_FULL_43_5]